MTLIQFCSLKSSQNSCPKTQNTYKVTTLIDEPTEGGWWQSKGKRSRIHSSSSTEGREHCFGIFLLLLANWLGAKAFIHCGRVDAVLELSSWQTKIRAADEVSHFFGRRVNPLIPDPRIVSSQVTPRTLMQPTGFVATSLRRLSG